MKQSTIEKRVKQIESSIERFDRLQEYERIFMLDYIEWLFQFKHIARNKRDELVDKIFDKYKENGMLL